MPSRPMTERVSDCCGAPELLPGTCAACHEHTSFEAEEEPDTRHADWARTRADVGLAAERGAK